MHPKRRRWQVYLNDGISLEVTTDGSSWTVTAAGAIRTTNHDLRAALCEVVGHLADTHWLNATSRLIETATETDQPGATGGDDRIGTRDPARRALQRTPPIRRQAPR